MVPLVAAPLSPVLPSVPLLASPDVVLEAEAPPSGAPNSPIVLEAVVVVVCGLVIGVPNKPVVCVALFDAGGAWDVCPALAPAPRPVLEKSAE